MPVSVEAPTDRTALAADESVVNPRRHAALNVAQYLLNNGFERLRSPRA